jgi:molybdenum cofactor cytidylyltransferase
MIALSGVSIHAVVNEETKAYIKEEYLEQINYIENKNPERGLLHSIKLGLQSTLEEQVKGFMICLADMPYLTTENYHEVLDCFRSQKCQKIVFPSIDGLKGHPVIFPVSYQESVLSMGDEDQGLKDLIIKNKDKTFSFNSNDHRYLRDVDRLADLGEPSGELS